MIFIYGHIFVIIRRHQANRRALIQHGSMARHTTPVSSTRAHSAVALETTASLRYPSHPSSVSSGRRLPASGKPTSFHRQRNNCSVPTNSESIDHSNNAVNRNVKVMTFFSFRHYAKNDHFAFKHICVCVDRPSSRRC